MTDAHVHIGRVNGKPADAGHNGLRQVLSNCVQAGLTALRDGGDRAMTGITARELSRRLPLNFITPVCALSRGGGYGAFLGLQARGLAELKASLGEIMKHRPDFIKVIQSGIVSFDRYGEVSEGGFTKTELEYIVGFAHDKGLAVMAHCNGRENVSNALETGADSIEHGYFIGAGELQAMSELGVFWTPTFAPLWNFLRSAGENRSNVIKSILDGHGANLRYALEAGVPVTVGSDAGAVSVGHADGVKNELDCFTSYGITRERAMECMTKNNTALFEKFGAKMT